MRGGVASIAPDENDSVTGVVWNISTVDEAALDRYEGVGSGNYRKFTTDVVQNGARMPALIYVAVNSGSGSARPGYMELIIKAAVDRGLPDAYIGVLQTWLPSRRLLASSSANFLIQAIVLR